MPTDPTVPPSPGRRSGARPHPAGTAATIGARFAVLVAIALLLAACATSPATSPLLLWTFDDDLEGWQTGSDDGDGWGTAQWRDWCGDDRDEGCVKLDGTGGSGTPNAWIFRTLDLPPGATVLRALTTAHDRDGADSLYRVRLIDAGATEHVLIDWAESSGSEGEYSWFEIEAPVAAFAGTTVTLYFEGADNGPGTHEQRYYDDIGIY